MLKYAKNHGNQSTHFEDKSRRCEHSIIVVYFFGPPCIIVTMTITIQQHYNDNVKLSQARMVWHLNFLWCM